MSTPGLNLPVKFYNVAALSLTLFALILWGYKFLRKMTLKARSIIIYGYFVGYGFNDFQAKCFTAQSAHETAGWTSDLYNTANNCFGMKYTSAGRCDGEYLGYAYYMTIENSCHDLRLWYNTERNKITSTPLVINSLADYVSFLKNCGYFEDTEENYLNGCQEFYNQLYVQ
jgi:hypothetical protein